MTTTTDELYTREALTRSIAEHRRGHAYYGTICPNGCTEAGKWAARRLITPRAMLAAGRAAGRFDGIAANLGVLPRDVYAYISDLDVDEWLIMQRLLGRDLTGR